MDISKLLPACFAQQEEKDAAFELLRNLMTASTTLLKECYIPLSSVDELRNPKWLYAKEKEQEGKALQTVFANTIWAISVCLMTFKFTVLPI